MKETLIEVRDLTKTFHSDKGTTKAIDRITFDLYKGETLGVAGESGCGKTTLGRCLVNLEPHDSGTIFF